MGQRTENTWAGKRLIDWFQTDPEDTRKIHYDLTEVINGVTTQFHCTSEDRVEIKRFFRIHDGILQEEPVLLDNEWHVKVSYEGTEVEYKPMKEN